MIITRDEAKAKGSTRFYTGEPCERGHVSGWLVSNAKCVDCLGKKSERFRTRKRSLHERGLHEKCSQAIRSKRWLEANREKSRASSAKWRKANLPIAAAAASRRKAKILQRTPAWADHDKIRQFYILAKDLTDSTGVKHEVDHIYPLQGKLVSGLHVETNLQILTKEANRAKGNRCSSWMS